MIIREIEDADYAALLPLWNRELGVGSVTADNIAPHFARVKGDDRYRTYVALVDGEVAGFISSAQTYAVGFDGAYMQVTAMAVRADAQGMGIGTKLIARMEAYARERGCYAMGMCSGFKRTDAHAFYESKGFAKGSYAFNKMLDR